MEGDLDDDLLVDLLTSNCTPGRTLDDVVMEYSDDEMNCTKLEQFPELFFPKEATKLDKMEPKDAFHGLSPNIKSLIFRIKNIKSLYDWQDECLNLN